MHFAGVNNLRTNEDIGLSAGNQMFILKKRNTTTEPAKQELLMYKADVSPRAPAMKRRLY